MSCQASRLVSFLQSPVTLWFVPNALSRQEQRGSVYCPVVHTFYKASKRQLYILYQNILGRPLILNITRPGRMRQDEIFSALFSSASHQLANLAKCATESCTVNTL